MARVGRFPYTGLIAAMALLLVPAPPAPAGVGGGALRATVAVPLTIAMTGTGHVTSDPAGIDCTDGAGACSADFPDGTPVTLTATPPDGFTVSFPTTCGAGITCLVDAGLSSATVDVLFAADPTLYLLVTGTGAVRATPLGQAQEPDEDGVSTCNNLGWQSPTPDVCRLQFAPGRRVLLEVIPNGSNATFIDWSDPTCTGQPTCTVVMPTVADGARHAAALRPHRGRVVRAHPDRDHRIGRRRRKRLEHPAGCRLPVRRRSRRHTRASASTRPAPSSRSTPRTPSRSRGCRERATSIRPTHPTARSSPRRRPG